MKNLMLIVTTLVVLLFFSGICFGADSESSGQAMANPGYYEKPGWFKDSFLDLAEDLQEASDNNKKLFLYFHQDGCPYCEKLLKDNFSRKDIITKMQQSYDVLEINIWGDKAITLLSGEEVSEKEFARRMKVMFTPTSLILDKKGNENFRMNGYYAPDKFTAVLDYAILEKVQKPSFNDYYRQQKQALQSNTQAGLHTEAFIHKGNDLSSWSDSSKKPVLILFEQTNCPECNELHGDIFRRLAVYQQLKQFSIAQININSDKTIITPDGQSMTEKQFAQQLKIQYTPSMLFYNKKHEVFRSEAYLKGFHVQSLLEYISSQAYLSEPEFQRFIQKKADKMHEQGIEVELWK